MEWPLAAQFLGMLFNEPSKATVLITSVVCVCIFLFLVLRLLTPVLKSVMCHATLFVLNECELKAFPTSISCSLSPHCAHLPDISMTSSSPPWAHMKTMMLCTFSSTNCPNERLCFVHLSFEAFRSLLCQPTFANTALVHHILNIFLTSSGHTVLQSTCLLSGTINPLSSAT